MITALGETMSTPRTALLPIRVAQSCRLPLQSIVRRNHTAYPPRAANESSGLTNRQEPFHDEHTRTADSPSSSFEAEVTSLREQALAARNVERQSSPKAGWRALDSLPSKTLIHELRSLLPADSNAQHKSDIGESARDGSSARSSRLKSIDSQGDRPSTRSSVGNRSQTTTIPSKSTGEMRTTHTPALATMRPIPVFITGGSGIIGKAIAHAFATHPKFPFHVTLSARSEENLMEARSALPKLAYPGWDHSILVGDCTQPEFWGSKERVWTDDPRQGVLVPAILINCAGLSTRELLTRLSPMMVQELLNVNLLSSTWGCKLFVTRKLLGARRKMLASGATEAGFTPSIVNVGSLLSTRGGKGSAVYAAAKAGLLGLTRALAAEYGPLGIRVNVVLPGFIDSSMAQQEKTENASLIKRVVPCQRLGTPEEVADAVVFLALNNYANNCQLNLDGGLGAVNPLEDFLPWDN